MKIKPPLFIIWFLPTVRDQFSSSEFWTFSKQLQEINSTVETLPLSLSYSHIAAWKVSPADFSTPCLSLSLPISLFLSLSLSFTLSLCLFHSLSLSVILSLYLSLSLSHFFPHSLFCENYIPPIVSFTLLSIAIYISSIFLLYVFF